MAKPKDPPPIKHRSPPGRKPGQKDRYPRVRRTRCRLCDELGCMGQCIEAARQVALTQDPMNDNETATSTATPDSAQGGTENSQQSPSLPALATGQSLTSIRSALVRVLEKKNPEAVIEELSRREGGKEWLVKAILATEPKAQIREEDIRSITDAQLQTELRKGIVSSVRQGDIPLEFVKETLKKAALL